MDTINYLVRLINKVKTSYIIQDDSPSFLISFKSKAFNLLFLYDFSKTLAF